MALKYNSGINIMGSIPDYTSMIEYISEEYEGVLGNGSFKFRTEKSMRRFIAAINDSVLVFVDERHRKLFYDGLTSNTFSVSEKMMLIFWQMIFSNHLYHDITAEVFMKAVYQGRKSLSLNDIYSYVRYLKEQNPNELKWAEVTLKVLSSKYLTILKKIGLADGSQRKSIKYPLISDKLFVYFIRWCLCVFPSDCTISNPYIKFGFCDKMTLISKLKKIEFIQYWDITQLNDDVTIELKPYE